MVRHMQIIEADIQGMPPEKGSLLDDIPSTG
jgi:hypothetical protein